MKCYKQKHQLLLLIVGITKDFINDLLSDGSNKVRPIAKELLDSIRSSVGINKIS